MLIIFDYQSYIHKHPHELLDSVVKERFDQAFRLNRGRAFYSSLLTVKLFSKISFYSTACRLDQSASLVSGRRIIQRPKPLSTTFQPLPINPTEATNRTQPPPCQRGAFYSNPPPVQPFIANLLIYKRFCLMTAPEVVRIIGT